MNNQFNELAATPNPGLGQPVAETTKLEMWSPYYGAFVRLPDTRITDITPIY